MLITEIIIENNIVIKNPQALLLKWVKNNLIFKNPEYTKKIQMGFYAYGTPKNIQLFSYNNGVLSLPSGCYDEVMRFVTDNDNIIDKRSVKSADIKSNIILRDYQVPATTPFSTRFHHHDNGLIVIPCGLGKTQIALEIASRLKQKALFLTHTVDLLKQAHGRCEGNLECTTSLVTDGKCDITGDFVFSTVQTMVKMLDKIPKDTFGLVIIDEIHRMATNSTSIGMFRECCEYFSAKYKVGLTATLHRADGLECCIPRIVGNIVYEITEDGEDYVGYIDTKEVVRFPKSLFQVPAKINFVETDFSISFEQNGVTRFRDVFDKSGMTISFAKLMNELCSDYKRNALIINIANKIKGSTLILSDRVSQLEYLQSNIPDSVLITGDTNKKIREKALEDVGKGKIKCLVASYKIAKEGLDLPIVCNLIMCSPVKDSAVVEQCVGRIQRPYEGKQIGNVYDIVDPKVTTLDRFYRKRKAVYKKKGWM